MGLIVALETNSRVENTGMEVIQEVVSTRDLKQSYGKISVSVSNIADLPVKLWAQMLLRQVNPATPVSPSNLVGGGLDEINMEKFTHRTEQRVVCLYIKSRLQIHLLCVHLCSNIHLF